MPKELRTGIHRTVSNAPRRRKVIPTMATPNTDPDDAIFKELGVEEDDDKQTLKAEWVRSEYIRKKREAAESANRPAKKGLFGGRK